MKQRLQRWLETSWYASTTPLVWLRALGRLFETVVFLRRWLYRKGYLASTKLPVPVIIVGNLSVGGTGKSPLTLFLAEALQQVGYRPGIISRGYGGHATAWPQRVYADSDPTELGDEAVMLASRSQAPVAVGPRRCKTAEKLLAETDCNILLADDGLQHYALKRDIEIVLIDGERRFGNGYCLPAGPLREPITRLTQVDLIVVNGTPATSTEYRMQPLAEVAINLSTGERRSLHSFTASSVHAIAGIGNPQRFYSLLHCLGIQYVPLSFPDHHHFIPSDIQFTDALPVLMTEKDAVKCRSLCTAQHWYVPIQVQLEPRFMQNLLFLLNEKHHGPQLT